MIESLTLRNYRAIDGSGITIPLGSSFVALVGPNNSGKSSVLRALFELRAALMTLSIVALDEFSDAFQPQGGSRLPVALPAGERVHPSWSDTANPRLEIQFARRIGDPYSLTKLTVIVSSSHRCRLEFEKADGTVVTELSGGMTNLHDAGRYLTVLRAPWGETWVDWPLIQSDLVWLSNLMYVGAFRNVVNSGGGELFDVSVGSAFISRFDEMKTGSDPLANEAILALSRRIAEVFELNSFDISASADKTHLVCMVDGRSMRLSELGAGLAQFVLVGASVLVRRPNILLIDEPELNLHAALQPRLLALVGEALAGPLIFATHSVGLARSSADMVFVLARGDDGSTRCQNYLEADNLSLSLGELGYGGLLDAAHKAVLLVEGATEVRLFKELLARRGLAGKVVVIPMGGDGLAIGGREVELEELNRLSDNVFAIVDSERTTSTSDPAARRSAFGEACARLNIDCTITERRATENYLDQDLARTIFRVANAPKFGWFDQPSPDWSWRKDQNWKIAARMPDSAWSGTDVESMLERIRATVSS